ncbi:hypothetical protein [Salinimonas chungwhensis]|uniref:hypothetical protein n=1 Tax=Salinimonas chungwhensis TaxID=265425 RepID=UPI0003A72559|nr:hypothetical protein [Salinimonas chungwhensis]
MARLSIVRKDMSGLGLVECLIATLLFVSGGIALSSLTLKWQWRVHEVAVYARTTAQQQLLHAHLGTITSADYATLSDYVPAVVQAQLNQPVESLVLQPQRLQHAEAELLYVDSALAVSDRINLTVSVVQGVNSEPIVLHMTAYRPSLYRYLSALPSAD